MDIFFSPPVSNAGLLAATSVLGCPGALPPASLALFPGNASCAFPDNGHLVIQIPRAAAGPNPICGTRTLVLWGSTSDNTTGLFDPFAGNYFPGAASPSRPPL